MKSAIWGENRVRMFKNHPVYCSIVVWLQYKRSVVNASHRVRIYTHKSTRSAHYTATAAGRRVTFLLIIISFLSFLPSLPAPHFGLPSQGFYIVKHGSGRVRARNRKRSVCSTTGKPRGISARRRRRDGSDTRRRTATRGRTRGGKRCTVVGSRDGYGRRRCEGDRRNRRLGETLTGKPFVLPFVIL